MKMSKRTSVVIPAIVFFLVAMLPIAAHAQAEVKISSQIETFGNQSFYMHTVEPQQTLFGISRAYNVTVEALLMANPDARSGLRVNQVLRVPTDKTPPPVQTQQQEEAPPAIADKYDYIYHVTGKNESFNYIANIYMVPVAQIRSANPGMREPIREGEYVVVPIAPKDQQQIEPVIRDQRPSFDPFQTPPVRTATQTERQAQAQLIQPDTRQTTAAERAAPTTTRPQVTDNQESGVQIINHFTLADPSSSPSTPSVGEGFGQHVVKPQETLFSIARSYGLSVEQLMAINSGISQILSVGQVLKVPKQDDAPTKQESTPQTNQDKDLITHTVSRGETLFGIARTYAVSIADLQRINPGLTDRIQVGQKILVPKKKITSPFIEHFVDSRITSRRMARNYDISLDRFYYFNPAAGRRLYPGQTVRIPIADHLTVGPELPVQTDTLLIPDPIVIDIPPTDPVRLISCPDFPAHSGRLFRVALLVPFFLDEAGQIGMLDTDAERLLAMRPFSFVQFYEGFLMAVDSLTKSHGLKLELYVYNVDQNPESLDRALSDPKLSGVDLMVGPFFNRSFETAARFARERKIPIINPMAQRSEIVDGFPNVIKIKPNTECQFEQLAALVATYYPDAKVFIYRHHSWTNTEQSRKMKEALEKVLQPAVPVANQRLFALAERRSRGFTEMRSMIPFIRVEGREFQTAQLENSLYDASVFDNSITEFVYANDSVREFRHRASAIRENVVIAISDDNVFAMDLMNNLNRVADTFAVRLIGIPNWKDFENLFIESLLKMQMHHFVPGHVDYTTYQTEQFIHNYRQRFNAEPGSYAFEGFDIGFYFLKALMHFGDGMADCLPYFDPELSHTRFRFVRKNENSGLENCYWNIYRHQNHQLVPLINTYFDRNTSFR